jgi:hypothetical protein
MEVIHMVSLIITIIRVCAVIFILFKMIEYQFYAIKHMEDLLISEAPTKKILWLVIQDLAVLLMSIVVLYFFVGLP